MRWRTLIPLLIAVIVLAGCGDLSLGGSNEIEISIAYGSEKKAWLEAVTEEFNNQQVQTPDGQTIRVNITPMGSNDSLQQILAGTIQPTVWSPASSILIPAANQSWAEQGGEGRLVDGSEKPLVLSPVVIAMWEPMARALGWPDTPIGWGDIADIARSGETWADYGYPEWGDFQFGHTHPDYSNSGITSIMAMAYAATGKTRGLTVADVERAETADFIAAVESRIIHYGESTGFFANQMFNRGPSYLSAAVLYENLVVESYDRTLFPNLGTPVVAVYPKEGTFWSDHPYVILNAPWVSPEQRVAAEQFRDYLLDRPQQERALQFGFRPADPSVAVGAPIIPENGVDPTQPQTLLEVPNIDAFRAVQQTWVSNKKRVDVLVVLDVSGSMQEEGRLENAKIALRSFVNRLDEQDGFGFVTFSTSATLVSPLEPIGPKRDEMINRISGLAARGNTRLVDTVREAYALLEQEPAGSRIRALIVLSDGADNRSEPGSVDALLNQLQSEVEGTSIKIFTIAYGSGADVNLELLELISEASGARTYESSPTEIEEIYEAIATFF